MSVVSGSTSLATVASRSLRHHGVNRGLSNDLARAGFTVADMPAWAPVVAELGVTEAGFFRLAGMTPTAALELAAEGGNGLAVLLTMLGQPCHRPT